jgi:hypothetical protein
MCIACLHVGQMLFAGNKYELLKRITVYNWPADVSAVIIREATFIYLFVYQPFRS